MTKKLSPETLIAKSGLSLRAKNVLLQHCEDFGIKDIPGKTSHTMKLQDLEGLSLGTIRGYRGAGKKTMVEIAEVCREAGVKINDSTDHKATTRIVSIHFDKYTQNGKVLLSLVKLLGENDQNIIIEEN